MPLRIYEKSKLSSDTLLNTVATIEYLAVLPRSHEIAFI